VGIEGILRAFLIVAALTLLCMYAPYVIRWLRWPPPVVVGEIDWPVMIRAWRVSCVLLGTVCLVLYLAGNASIGR